jgi:hypothetical protein
VAKTVGHRLQEILISAGFRRCYGSVGDALKGKREPARLGSQLRLGATILTTDRSDRL